MRKRVFVLSLILVLVVMTALFAGCNRKDDLAKFIDNYSQDNISYQIEIEMAMPLFGDIVYTTEVDGNITHELPFLFTSETYKEEITGGYYSYTKDYDDKWVIDFVPETSNTEISNNDPGTFSAEDFKYKKGSFVLKEDRCESYGVKSMSIEVTENGKGAVITMTQVVDGLSLNAKATFSKYNEIHITLPVDRHSVI